ncbi:MAG TPA: hypothetical protein VI756_07760 [Blastocatellia bacterium]
MELLRSQFAFSSDEEEDQFVDDLMDSSATIDEIRENIEDKDLGRYLMWATFDLEVDGEPSGRDPFYSIPPDAASIAARLGLSHSYKGQDLFLLIYDLPGGTQAHYPTAAESYADNEWPFYFRPSREGDRFGSTMPWDGGLKPCPELVHEVVKGTQISDRIRIARW